MDATVFSNELNEYYVSLLAQTDYAKLYRELCVRYNAYDVCAKKLNVKETISIFQRAGVVCRFNRRFNVFFFDKESISDWEWEATLVVKLGVMLEPMAQGVNRALNKSVGSTFGHLASEAGRRQEPPVLINPPMTRPMFDGDMATMERMVPDLVRLFRLMKDAVRRDWPHSS